jgi:predicted O-methyltransferase YrrM
MSNIVQNELEKFGFATIHGTIPGHCNVNSNDWINIDKLIEMVQRPGLQLCEIGTNSGHSTCLLGIWARNLDGKVITMDPMAFPNDIAVEECLRTNLIHFSLTRHVQFIKDYSYNVVDRFADEFFDLIFIDGDHAYEKVQRDIELYYPKLKTGGIMCGHDCEFLVNKDGIGNIHTIRNNDFQKPYRDGFRTMYGHETVITVADNGAFNLKKISNWPLRDIIGLYWNKDLTTQPVIGVHPGTVIAVSERFGDTAQIYGDRIWWVKKS